jgi:hypothetical protein
MVEISTPTAPGRRRYCTIECTPPEHGQGHNAIVLADWFHLKLLDLNGSNRVVVDGRSLNIAAVTSVARYVFGTKIVKLKWLHRYLYDLFVRNC